MGKAQIKYEDDFNGTLVQGAVKSAMASVGAKSNDLWKIPVGEIQVLEGFNVRVRNADYEKVVEEIANSIQSEGFYQHCPLAGFVSKEGGKEIVYVTNGHRRLEAAKLAIARGCQIESLPVVLSAKGVSLEDLTVELVRGNEGNGLTVYERARAAKRLSVNFGMSRKVISERLNISTFYVDGLLLLMSAPREVHELVVEGTVSATRAIELLREHGSEAVAEMQKGKEAAKAQGSARVKARHIGGPKTNKLVRMVKKDASGMYTALKDVTADPGFKHISKDLKEKLATLLERLDKAAQEDRDAEAANAEANAASNELAKSLVEGGGETGAVTTASTKGEAEETVANTQEEAAAVV